MGASNSTVGPSPTVNDEENDGHAAGTLWHRLMGSSALGSIDSGELDISDRNLETILPDTLHIFVDEKYPLSNVQKLYARRNRISQIPSQVAIQFSSLTEVSFRDNAFTEFPQSLCQLNQIQKISLAFNHITSIPKDIANLTKLEMLSLAGNELVQLPEEIGLLSCLKALDVQKNKLIAVPKSINRLSKLTCLLLQKNNITELPDFTGLSHLKILNLSYNKIPNLDTSISSLKHLTDLILSSNQIDEIPADIFLSLKYLSHFDIHSNRLRSVPASVGTATALKRLNLAINIIEELPNEIGDLTYLQWLNMNDNKLKVLPPSIGKLKSLNKIGLVQNQLIALPNEIVGLRNLTKIDLRQNAITALPPCMKYLKSLNHILIANNPLITTVNGVAYVNVKESKPKLNSLLELSARALWSQDSWKLHRLSECTNLNHGVKLAAKHMIIPDHIEETSIPLHLKYRVARPSICHYCLKPFCSEAIEYIEQTQIKATTDVGQIIPTRFWLCSHICLSGYKRRNQYQLMMNSDAVSATNQIQDRTSTFPDDPMLPQELRGQAIPTQLRSFNMRSRFDAADPFFSYVSLEMDGMRTTILDLAMGRAENQLPLNWLASQFRSAERAAGVTPAQLHLSDLRIQPNNPNVPAPTTIPETERRNFEAF